VYDARNMCVCGLLYNSVYGYSCVYMRCSSQEIGVYVASFATDCVHVASFATVCMDIAVT